MTPLPLAVLSKSSKFGKLFHCCNCRPTMSIAFANALGLTTECYDPPTWVRSSGLKMVPSVRVKLAHGNTPIHKWDLPGVPSGVEVFIKRDDMTGCTLSGNKVRKLEFLLADAMQKGCKHVITAGGIQSNHCRATVVAAAQLGMKSHLLLRADIQDVSEVGCGGNMFLNKMCGAEMYFVPKSASMETDLVPRMERLAKHIKEQTGEEVYNIPIGGSNSIGFFGYLEGFRELECQGALEQFDDLVFSCGSGGTLEGLAAGNYLAGSKLRIHGICACDSAAYFHGHANEVFSDLGLGDLRAEAISDVIEGRKGKGYGVSTQEELDFITQVSKRTGVILDPTYTGKAAKGLVEELNTNLQRFKGRRILFLHTGGIYGAYDGRLGSALEKGGAADSCHMWMEQQNPPF